MNLTPINEPLDPEIAPVVELLRGEGFDTFSSCQGGEGHAFPMPTVRIQPVNYLNMSADEYRLSQVLSQAGYAGYYIKQCRAYQGDDGPWQRVDMHFIEVEFWKWPLKEVGSDNES